MPSRTRRQRESRNHGFATSERRRQLRIELLETRKLLTVTSSWVAADSHLTVTSDGAGDTITISANASNEILVNGSVVSTSALSTTVQRIDIAGGGGNDTIDVRGVTTANNFTSALKDNVFITGDDGNDTIHGSPFDDILQGNAGDDTIYGYDGGDFLDAGASFSGPTDIGPLGAALDEASGVVVSRNLGNTMWVIDDDSRESGTNAGRLFSRKTSDASSWATTTITGAVSKDWEDIAYYERENSDGSYTNFIYIGDIGDGGGSITNSPRSGDLLAIYRVQEPSTSTGTPTLDGYILLDPPASRNFEAMMVDPGSGHIYVISRDEGGSADPKLYRTQTVPTSSNWSNNDTITLLDKGTLDFDGTGNDGEVRGADISRDGLDIVVIAEDVVHHYARESYTQPIENVLVGTGGEDHRRSDWIIDTETGSTHFQREGVSFGKDSTEVFVVSEEDNSDADEVHRYNINDTGDDDWLLGGNGNDFLRTRAGDDYAYGGNGNDYLFSGRGDDTLIGEGGSDTYFFPGVNLGTDYVTGESANTNADTLDFSRFYAAVDVDLSFVTASQTVSAGNLVLRLYNSTAIENVYGSRFDDDITGNSRNNYVFGLAGADTISLKDGADVGYGGKGDDLIYGGKGNDSIIGESGTDEGFGGDGTDSQSSIEDWTTDGANEP